MSEETGTIGRDDAPHQTDPSFEERLAKCTELGLHDFISLEGCKPRCLFCGALKEQRASS